MLSQHYAAGEVKSQNISGATQQQQQFNNRRNRKKKSYMLNVSMWLVWRDPSLYNSQIPNSLMLFEPLFLMKSNSIAF